ncbi:MAG: HAD-IC family P-type ATPase, partial [Nitrososphaeraceae archaeon]
MSKLNINKIRNNKSGKDFISEINSKVILESVTKLNPYYLARYNPVMFTVEVGFFLVLFIAIFPNISSEFVGKNQIVYVESAIILILTVWFATFSESLSEAQARAKVDSLRNLEKEVLAHKIANGNGKMIDVKSTSLKPGDEVRVYSGEIIPRDGLVCEGKAFVDESMMTGESNPVFKEKGDHVIGGTKVASDNMIVEITAEAGRSFLDQMVSLIQNATRPKTQNEIALTILLAGLSLIFIIVIGTLLFLAYFLGYKVDIVTLVALLVALMPTTIGALLPAIGVAGITRLGRDNIVAKSGKGIEAAGDCDVLILDKTGTITEGSRSAISFIPLEKYTEIDVGQAAFAASIHDTSHEGKSIVDLAEEKKFLPPVIERLLTAKSIEFSAETKVSGIEFVPLKETRLTKEQLEEFESLTKFITEEEKAGYVVQGSDKRKVADMLVKLAQSGEQVKILKGSVDAMLNLSEGHVNEAEVKWKSQQISKEGETPLLVSINQEVIGLIALKDNLKENIRENIG